LRFGWGYAIQIAHEGNADAIGVVPLAMRPHAFQRARGMHCAVRGYHEVVRDIRVAPPLHADSELLQRGVYPSMVNDDLSDGTHG
jgi:hypothetical protein